MTDFDLNTAIPSYGGTMNPDDVGESGGDEESSPFRVLGIALVVDQKGKEAKMVLRYPTMLPWNHQNNNNNTNIDGVHKDNSSSSEEAATDDLFFRLPPRQIAKLFRPKRTLCGQAMTLSVGGTVFCCRAVIMKDTSSSSSSSSSPSSSETTAGAGAAAAGGEDEGDKVELFSLIVALVPRVQGSPIPITGLVEEKNEASNNNTSTTRSDRHNNNDISSNASVQSKTLESITTTRETESFLCVRRVHVSLTRLCRVLEREERRCRYVSLQTDFYSQIRKQARPVAPPPSISPASMASNSAAARPRRTNSFSSIFDRDNATTMESSSAVNQHRKHSGGRAGAAAGSTSLAEKQWEEAEREQEILETVMAAAPLTNNRGMIEHQGNMARELIQFYHALARNDNDFPPTPSLLLTGREGIVYVNRHIAVAIEAVTPSRLASSQEAQIPLVRPYHTLLFPKVSQKALLESLSTSGSTAPRRLQQLLLTVSPQKSLTEIAVDANLSQQTTMEIATYLVGHGACIASAVVSRNSRLACTSVSMIHKLSLSFSQAFGADVNLFVLVGFLTGSGWKLGEAISAMTRQDSNNNNNNNNSNQEENQEQAYSAPEVAWLRRQLIAALPATGAVHREGNKPVVASNDAAAAQVFGELVAREHDVSYDPHLEQLEDILFQMAVWLCSHRVLVHLQEYLVATTSSSTTQPAGDRERSGSNSSSERGGGLLDTTSAEKKTDFSQQQPFTGATSTISSSMVSNSSPSAGMSASMNNHSSSMRQQQESILMSDEILFRELQELDCLAGKVSIPACCWRLGIEPGRLHALAHRHANISIITRVAEPTDDWAATL